MATYKSVMLIDDNEIDNIINERIIESSDFAETIMVYSGGQDALEYLTNNQENPDALPELIFLDINMPIMDGFQFLDAFDKLYANVKSKCKIVMVSSSISPKDIDRAASNPLVKKYLNKPLKERYLQAL